MFSVEDAPFKLTAEMVEVMGGRDSVGFQRYVKLMCAGFTVLERHHNEILTLISTIGQHSPFPCFAKGHLKVVAAAARKRLFVGMDKRAITTEITRLIEKSYNALGTRR